MKGFTVVSGHKEEKCLSGGAEAAGEGQIGASAWRGRQRCPKHARSSQRCFLLHLEPLLDPSRDLLGQGVATPPPAVPGALAPAAQPAGLAAPTLSRPWHLDLAVPDVLLPRAEPPVLLPPLASLDASSAPSRGPPAHSAVEASTV